MCKPIKNIMKHSEPWMDVSSQIAEIVVNNLISNYKRGHYPRTHRDLSNLTGLTPTYLEKILKGKENLSMGVIVSLEIVLDIKLIKI